MITTSKNLSLYFKFGNGIMEIMNDKFGIIYYKLSPIPIIYLKRIIISIGNNI